MYWWKVSKLAEDFRQDRVDEKERFKYLLASAIVAGSGAQLVSYFGWGKVLHIITAAAMVPITIIETMQCFRTNRSGDNSDFIGRMVCLSWPISIKVLVLLLTLFAIIGFTFGLFIHTFNVFFAFYYASNTGMGAFDKRMAGEVVSLLYLDFGIPYLICYYWILRKCVRIISTSR